MATTTNYNWSTPDDTDLVKDGASAIRTLGSSADTTVKNLNPGTTAGDIDYYTSSTAKARIAIGTAGQVLQVNSGATAPEWAAPVSAAFVGCSAYKATTAQSLTNNAETVITYNTEEFDTDGFHSTVTNTSRFTIPTGKGGKYLVVATAATADATGIRQLTIFKNGTAVNRILQTAVSGFESQMLISCIVDLVATDYVELGIYQNSGSAINAVASQNTQRFTLQYLGA
jgi:hypothetical protein